MNLFRTVLSSYPRAATPELPGLVWPQLPQKSCIGAAYEPGGIDISPA